MRKLLMLFGIIALVSCGNQPKETNEPAVKAPLTAEEMKNMSFEQLFTDINPDEMTDNILNLVGKDYTIITSGKSDAFNSMTASWGGIGILFNKPVTFCMLRSNRYTLEVIKNEQTYTFSYFPDEYKDQVLFLGSKSGRDSDKMKEITLTPVQTPDGNTSYKEAKVIIECKLLQTTTVDPADYYQQDAIDFVVEAYNETKEYHKLVFGEITKVWVKK